VPDGADNAAREVFDKKQLVEIAISLMNRCNCMAISFRNTLAGGSRFGTPRVTSVSALYARLFLGRLGRKT
jgi:hypothetical protein